MSDGQSGCYRVCSCAFTFARLQSKISRQTQVNRYSFSSISTQYTVKIIKMSTRRASVGSGRRRSSIADVDHLAALGVKQELKRNFSMFSMLGLSFAILNSWTALSASLSLALPSGGSTSVLWGLITAGICNLCLAASLAEFLSAYPTAGGQYHWVAIISWKNWTKILSWVTGWVGAIPALSKFYVVLTIDVRSMSSAGWL